MAVALAEPFLKGETGRNTRGLLRLIILCTIAGAAVASRLFSVISMDFYMAHPSLIALLLSASSASLTLPTFRVRKYYSRVSVDPLNIPRSEEQEQGGIEQKCNRCVCGTKTDDSRSVVQLSSDQILGPARFL